MPARALAGGFIIGIGGSWILFWLLALLSDRVGIYGNNAFLVQRLVEKEGSSNLAAGGKARSRRLVTMTRRSVPIALAVVVVGIIVAAV